MKKQLIKTFTPISAVAAAFGLAADAHAGTPLFEATFPASWNGTSTTVTDQSGAGNTGYQSGTTHASYTTAAVPPGALAGTGSMALDGAAGIKVTPTGLLNNAAIANAGGFVFSIDFLWNGADTSGSFGGTQKLIDYAGTESLQLVVPAGAGSASLQMLFADNGGAESIAALTTIAPNTWYNVKLAFDTTGNSLDPAGDISGTANLFVNGTLVSSGSATKGTYGDTLNRPIGIGEWGYGHNTSLIGLTGDIYGASIQLGVTPVPEPSTLSLGAVGALALLGARRRKS